MRIGKYRVSGRALALVFGGASLSALVAIGATWTRTEIPSFSTVRDRYEPSDVWVLDQRGFPLESIRAKNSKRSLEWVNWETVSPAFHDLLIKTEDQRFYSHPGMDPLALAHAAYRRLLHRSSRGASTITMQLVGLLEERRDPVRRGLFEKLHQIIAALKMERKWTKPEILEAYVNLIPFRGELVGLRAASLGYFAKQPSGLVKEESALLVGLIRAPNANGALVASRACLMVGETDCEQVKTIAEKALSKPYEISRKRELVPVLSPYFIEGDGTGSVIKTTLDHRIQALALDALREQIRNLKSQNVNDGAVLVLETKTGRVVAYAGNAGAGISSAEQVDGIRTRRQAGSTIKPFVYATAFDWKYLEPSSLLDDSPADIPIADGRVYQPKNYDHIFRGLVSAGDALGSSLNVPAVRALRFVGEEKVLDRLRAIGFQELEYDDYYGPSLALGAIDITLWELTQGYRQFSLENSVFSAKTREKIFNVLASPEHRRFTFGMGGLLTLPFPAAVKTGTSKDMRDNWCVGWTPEYTVGVWVGNFNGAPMWNVSGMSGAAPIWRSLMLALHPYSSRGVAHYEGPGTPLPVRTLSRIRYPAKGMLVGIDPDIPKKMQKLPIAIENPQKGYRVFLNKKLLSVAEETTLWSPRRGNFLVELKTPEGRLVDSVKFEVR